MRFPESKIGFQTASEQEKMLVAVLIDRDIDILKKNGNFKGSVMNFKAESLNKNIREVLPSK